MCKGREKSKQRTWLVKLRIAHRHVSYSSISQAVTAEESSGDLPKNADSVKTWLACKRYSLKPSQSHFCLPCEYITTLHPETSFSWVPHLSPHAHICPQTSLETLLSSPSLPSHKPPDPTGKRLKFTFLLGFPGGSDGKESACKLRINLQNIQAAHAAQYQKNKQSNQQVGKRTK